MAVDNPKVIDFIGVDRATGRVVLTISDHLDWTDTDAHQFLLQEKLNTYLAFVESGEILDRYQEAQGREVVLNVILKFQPDEKGSVFLARAREAIDSAGFTLTVSVL